MPPLEDTSWEVPDRIYSKALVPITLELPKQPVEVTVAYNLPESALWDDGETVGEGNYEETVKAGRTEHTLWVRIDPTAEMESVSIKRTLMVNGRLDETEATLSRTFREEDRWFTKRKTRDPDKLARIKQNAVTQVASLIP